MFDDIKCEFPLPLPEDQGELAGGNWREQGLQTKSFECLMDEYCIRADGTLWKQTYLWETTRKGRPCRKTTGWMHMQAFTGTVSFYNFIYGNAHDYWVEWTGVFVSGRLTELELHCWEQRDNRDRLASEARWRAQCEKREQFLSTWTGQRLYPAYARLVHGWLGTPLYRFCRWLGHLFDRAAFMAMRLADKLAPHGDPIREKQRRRAFTNLFDDDENETKKPSVG